jgi:hypothetical protein
MSRVVEHQRLILHLHEIFEDNHYPKDQEALINAETEKEDSPTLSSWIRLKLSVVLKICEMLRLYAKHEMSCCEKMISVLEDFATQYRENNRTVLKDEWSFMNKELVLHTNNQNFLKK